MVLANAIYFKGMWAHEFEPSQTEEQPFRLSPEQTIDVPMMTQRRSFGYVENEMIQMLELSYVGEELSMIVVLPKELGGLARLEDAFKPERLNEWLSSLRPHDVLVTLPKFKMESQFRLERLLSSMGMPDAFGHRADFSGMADTNDLYSSAIIHKAFVDVNEEGTEAAAATAVVVRATSAVPVEPRVFCADHPFVFLIRHNPSGSILFLGRVENPGAPT
jgi:serpin B